MERLHLATGTAEVLASLRRSLAGDAVTAPVPTSEPERAQTLAMLEGVTAASSLDDDTAAVVATSGSTGRPRGVRLSRAALLASAAATHRRLGGPGDWVLALPSHYVAGLMVLVRALVAGSAVHTIDAGPSGLRELDEIRRGDRPVYVSLVPTQLTRALATPDLDRTLRRFDAVLLGGAAASPTLLERAAAAGIRVVTTYGMSETCGGCVYDGVPLDGVEVEIERDTGRIRLKGPVLFSGYLDAPPRADDWFATGDRGEWANDRLRVLGRLDSVVTSGGYNVDLDGVERALRGLTDAEVAVLGLPDDTWGTRIVAVSAEISDGLAARLAAGLTKSLPAYALPRDWHVLPVLPRTAGGKIDRQRLIRELTDREAS